MMIKAKFNKIKESFYTCEYQEQVNKFREHFKTFPDILIKDVDKATNNLHKNYRNILLAYNLDMFFLGKKFFIIRNTDFLEKIEDYWMFDNILRTHSADIKYFMCIGAINSKYGPKLVIYMELFDDVFEKRYHSFKIVDPKCIRDCFRANLIKY